jgi:hypothetical protein
MTDMASEGPSLIKLGKLANSKEFDKLEDLWLEALNQTGYSWKELVPIAGQVGRQGAVDRAETLMEMIISQVEEQSGPVEALKAVRKGAEQLPTGKTLVGHLKRLYLSRYPDFVELSDLLDLVLGNQALLSEAVPKIELYVHLQPGAFTLDRSFLVPGEVQAVSGTKGIVTVLFQDRKAEYGPDTLGKLAPRPIFPPWPFMPRRNCGSWPEAMRWPSSSWPSTRTAMDRFHTGISRAISPVCWGKRVGKIGGKMANPPSSVIP